MKVQWNNSFLSRKYKVRQRTLSQIVLWVTIAVIILWAAWKKGIWDMIMRGPGIFRLEIPLFSHVWNFFYTRASITFLLMLFLAAYIIWRTIWIFCYRKKPVRPSSAYEYDNMAGFFLLKREFVQVRSFYLYLLAAEAVLACGVKYLLEHNGGLEESFVMIIAILLYTWEKFDYYNGYTAEEYWKMGASVSADKSVLHKPYTISASELEKRLMEIQCSEDYKERCMGYYWYQILSDMPDVHMEFMEAALCLGRHQSAYFSSAFYQDIGPYIFPFLNLELLENKKILVLSGRQDEEQVADWLRMGLQEKSGRIIFWTSKEAEQKFSTADIAVVSFEYIQKIPECRDSYSFWHKTAAVLLLEPSCFFSCPLQLLQLLSRFSVSREKPVYLACGRNEDGIADWLSHMAKEEILPVSPVSVIREDSYVIIDTDKEAEGETAWHIPYFVADAMKLLDMPGRKAEEKIFWYGNRLSPVCDIEHEMQNYTEIAKIFEFYLDGTESPKREYAWNVAEDTAYNVREALYQYDTRGYKAAYTAVCSPHYMLRNYMLSHMEQKILSLAPEFVHSERNMAIAVGYELIKGNTDWEDIKRILLYYDTEKTSMPILLKKLNKVYKEILGLDFMQVAEDYFNRDPKSVKKRIVIVSEKGRKQFMQWYKENMDMVLWEGTDRKEGLQEIAGGHIYQYCLPGQFITAEGKYYRVENVSESEERKLVKVKRASDSCRHRRYYRQIRNIFLTEEDSAPAACYMKRENIQIEQYYADIMICTEANLCSSSFYDFRNADRGAVLVPNRHYKKKAYLKIAVNSRTGIWVGILLKEMFYTFFPQCWQLLSVAVGEKQQKEEMKERLDSVKGDKAEKDSRLIFYVIEDSPVDLGLIETIGGKFETILFLINQYVDWGNREGADEIKKYFGSGMLQEIRE